MTGESIITHETANEIDEVNVAFQERVDQASSLLKFWYQDKDTDSISVRDRSQRGFALACEDLEKLITETQRQGRILTLTIGEQIDIDSEPYMPTYLLTRGTYDFVHADRTKRQLRAGDRLEFKSFSGINFHERQVRHIYVGEYGRKVEMGELAQALAQGSIIGVSREADIPEPETAA